MLVQILAPKRAETFTFLRIAKFVQQSIRKVIYTVNIRCWKPATILDWM